jgi:hypothetical protein
MAKITCGSLIRRAGGPNIFGTAGCLVQWPGKTEQLLFLTAARVLVGRTAEQFEAVEAVEAVDQPGKPIGCLYAWSDLQGPTTADVALVHVDPALVDPGIGPSGAPKGTNLKPAVGDRLTFFADGKGHNLTITDFGDKTIDRVTPDSRASVNYLNQIICDPATEDRCVGAMAMDGSNNIVGMVVGGNGQTFTLVTPIDALLSCTFGGPPGPALQVCTSIPATAKPPEKVTHPDHIGDAPRSTATGLDGQSLHQKEVKVEDGDALFIQKAPGVIRDLIRDFPELTVEQAAAILGNIGQECGGFTLFRQQGNMDEEDRGYGWCQWTRTRRHAFFKYADDNSLPPEDDKASYGYLLTELKGSEAGAFNIFKQEKTLENAVITFNNKFERSGTPMMDKRIRYAKLALEFFKNS